MVTGASVGIGEAGSLLLAKFGGNVVLHYYTNDSNVKRIEETLASLEKSGSFFSIRADLRKEMEVLAMYQAIVEQFHDPTDLVNNAGIWPSEYIPLWNMKLEHWNNTLQTNLTSIFLTTKYFLQSIQDSDLTDPGIVLIGSTAGVFGEAGHIDYSSSKSAMRGFMLSLKNEIVTLFPRGRVNLVNPGWVLTPMAEKSLTDRDAVKRILQTIPLRKVARPTDIANVVAFLLSPVLAGHITGQEITVSGGMEGRVLYNPDEINTETLY